MVHILEFSGGEVEHPPPLPFEWEGQKLSRYKHQTRKHQRKENASVYITAGYK